MAIQVFQQPGTISFAGDPIIAKAKTTLVGKEFLRITLQCSVMVNRTSDEFSYKEDYTYYVASDGIAIFNVGNTVKAALDKYCEQNVAGTSIQQTLYSAKYQLIYKEVFFDGFREVEGSSVISEWYNGIMGGLSEFERMAMPNEDVAAVIGNGRMLTRKPIFEIVPAGITYLLPAVSTQAETINGTVTQAGTSYVAANSYTGGVNIPISLQVNLSKLSPGAFRIDTDFESGKDKFLVSDNPSMRHFIFLNGFGLLESISCVVRESLKYTMESSQYVMPVDINFKGSTRTVSYTTTPQVTLDMSSGYVNREWAEWWVNEFLPTRMAWMLLDGRYIPVAIIPEKDNKLFDRSKPGMMAVQFKVQYSFAGGTYNSFVR